MGQIGVRKNTFSSPPLPFIVDFVKPRLLGKLSLGGSNIKSGQGGRDWGVKLGWLFLARRKGYIFATVFSKIVDTWRLNIWVIYVYNPCFSVWTCQLLPQMKVIHVLFINCADSSWHKHECLILPWDHLFLRAYVTWCYAFLFVFLFYGFSEMSGTTY